jgi:hypothetical protein
MEFTKIAETLGVNFLLITTGVLIGIITIETVFLWYLVYWAGGLRNLFLNTLKIYNHRTLNTNDKGGNSNPSVKEKNNLI